MKVVSDTSPIIAFSNLGKLHIIKALFGRITIPRAVYEELSEGKTFQLEDWIQVEGIKDRGLYKMLRSSLDHGESEAIILYFEKEMDLLLVDDGEARKVAASFEITFTGTGGLLLLGKKKGLISSVRTEIDTLRTCRWPRPSGASPRPPSAPGRAHPSVSSRASVRCAALGFAFPKWS